MSRRNKLLHYVRLVCVGMSLGVIVLSLESLWTEQEVFKTYALGLLIAGLVIISTIVARIVKTED